MVKGKTGKLEPGTEVCLFVGYPKGTRVGLFYSPQDKKVFVLSNATFLENDYMANFRPQSRVVLEELQSDQIRPRPERNKETTNPIQDVIVPRRSGRVSKQPIRYTGADEANFVVTDISDDDPLSYKHAMDDPDKDKWLTAMEQEMESMYSNSVWELVDLLESVRPIGCKWIYKKKRGVDGKVETFKARLVAKGYTPKEGVDYEQTFSPVSRKLFIIDSLLLCIAFGY